MDSAQVSQPRFTVRGVAAQRARAAAELFFKTNSNNEAGGAATGRRHRETPPISNQTRPEPSNPQSTGPWAANLPR